MLCRICSIDLTQESCPRPTRFFSRVSYITQIRNVSSPQELENEAGISMICLRGAHLKKNKSQLIGEQRANACSTVALRASEETIHEARTVT